VLLEDKTAWDIVTFEEDAATPPAVARLFELALPEPVMLLLRLLAVLVGIGICGSVFAYFFTRDARYLALAWRLFRWAIIVALVFFAL
jgi:hypothetical protein